MHHRWSLSLCVLLLACGETRIESVDDETLEKAEEQRAAADLKNEQTALLGTWQGCATLGEKRSNAYEYAFANDGSLNLRKNIFENPTCDESAAFTSENLKGTYKVMAKDEGTAFTLSIVLDGAKKLDSEYKLAGSASQFPNVFDWENLPPARLLELKEKEHFLALSKQAPGDAETMRQKAEQKIVSFAQTLLKRSGSWGSACADKSRTLLSFTSGASIELTTANLKYEDSDCKTKEKTQPDPVKSKVKIDFVMDLDKDVIQLLLTQGTTETKGTLQINWNAWDKILFNSKEYAFEAGAAP